MHNTMKARTAARELALLTLFQTGGRSLEQDQPLDQLILTSVRALVDDAREKVQSAVDALVPVSEYIQAQELEHPDNLESDFDAPIRPVPMPSSREMAEKIDQVLAAAEELYSAFDLPELTAHARSDEVQRYANRLIRAIGDHRAALDPWIEQFMEDWRMDRLSRMDANILRIASAEIKHTENMDVGVAINEAVELAKKYSTEESFRFVNGVLGGMARSLNVNVRGFEPPQEGQPGGEGVFDHLIQSSPGEPQ